ncbi:hypothetical protein HF638_21245 [Paenibacillus sp. SZ31]|uniref:hypothetical protein n=1 Tax=Paenibacillus sp. SZ31 TaxID=2725555 RepID=UPI00146E3536|nr:hypothetical protein [Paenibacillus sp. SZ31]NMI06514.1 hypothetical protein [Paenibacillus sp. SZ31]
MKFKNKSIIACAILIVSLTLFFSYGSVDAEREPGLLAGSPVEAGPVNIPDEWTDSNPTTYAGVLIGTEYSFNFSVPKDITEVYFFANNGSRLYIYSNDELLGEITGRSTDSTSYVSVSYQSVTKVVIFPKLGHDEGWVKGVDLYGTDSSNSTEEPPVVVDPEPTNSAALLEIYLVSGQTREYEVSESELNNFLSWYNKGGISGSEYYIFDKKYNLGKFNSRKDYIAYDKIEMFEVNQ